MHYLKFGSFTASSTISDRERLRAKQKSMASHHTACFLTMSMQILVLLISLPYVFTETSVSNTTSTIPDIVECGIWLLPLAPCSPFVQGSVTSPVQICCDNLIRIYDQKPNCLCIFVNDTNAVSFGINRTLAMQLPLVCKLGVNFYMCPGFLSGPDLPEYQAANGTSANSSSNAVSPMVAMPPKLAWEFGVGRNAGAKLKVEGSLLVLSLLTAMEFLFIEVVNWF